MKIGFIGLGIMGKPMARNLLNAGYDLRVYDIVQSAVDELVGIGAAAGSSPADVASNTDLIITILPNSPHVQEVILGDDSVIRGIRKGALVVDMSSIAPLVSREVSAALEEKGAAMLDAPVSGGEPKAVDGTLAIMVGGPEEAFERAKPVLEVMGGSVTLVGDIGSGNIAKLTNQIIVALNIASLSEAMVLAKKAGVDPERVFQAIRGGLAGSTVMDAKMPLILDGKFDPGFRIELHIKDLLNALETAHAVNVPVPLTGQVLEMMKVLKVDGKQGQDHGGLVQYFESMAGTEVRR